MDAIRNRVKRLEFILAKDLIPHEDNWRKHGRKQRAAMAAVLREVGYTSAVLAYETPDGLKLVDGHLRRETTPDEKIPVLVLDLKPEEAAKVLLTHDPLSAMADADAEKVDKLLREVQTGDEHLAGMLAELAQETGAIPSGSEGTSPGDLTDQPDLDAPPLSCQLIFSSEDQKKIVEKWINKLKRKYREEGGLNSSGDYVARYLSDNS